MIERGIPTAKDITEDWSFEDKKQYVIELLRSTNREGIENVIKFLNDTDYFEAPASTKYHSDYKHGLMDHSLSVYAAAMNHKRSIEVMSPDVAAKISDDSVAIVALLHDICKVNFYNETQCWKKDEEGKWVSYPGYAVNDLFPVGHGEKSVIMLQYLGFQLDVNEILAIRWHMGMFNDGGGNTDLKYSQTAAVKISPLVPLIQTADYVSSFLFEKTIEYK